MGTPQHKAIGHSIPIDQPKWEEQDNEGGRLCPAQTTYFSFLKSGDLLNHMCTEKLLGVQREWRQLTLSYLHSSAADTPWLRDACSHREGSGDTPNMDREPGKSEWLAKGKPEETPRVSDLNCYEGATRGLSLWGRLCVPPHVPDSFLLITTSRLRGNSFVQSQRARAFVTDHWSSG